ncbi:MAG TPA: ANTAR domain-containing protein [Mycobacteriales bacterium]|nr:ANTAR domain-containing protein [Mycobacteriales bacterium]
MDGAPLRGSEQGEDLDLTADTRERVADERARVAEEDLAGLRTAMDTRAVIEQAKGMIMITLKVDADAAFEVLVRRSQTSHVKLSDVAQEIVAKGMQP